MSYRLKLIAFFLIGILFTTGSLWAREDTAYMTFKKSAPVRKGTTVYTVKKGEWLLDIARRVTGEKKHVYSIIRKYNPGIKNMNLIYPGQKVILPVRVAADSSVDTAPKSTPPLPQQTGALKDDMSYPSQGKWNMVKHILSQIGATVTSQGKYYLPLRDMGQITIDCGKIPMVEFPDRGIVFIDFRNQIPDNIRQLVRNTWKNYAIIKVNPQSEATVLLEKIIQASNTHTMICQEQPLQIGSQPVLKIPASWSIISRSSKAAAPPLAIALWDRPDDINGLPAPLRDYAEAKGWRIIEFIQNRIVKAATDDLITSRPVSVIKSASLIDLTDECFRRLGVTTQKNTEVKIFDSARNGFDLSIEADLLASRGDQRLIVTSKKLPNQFLSVLRGAKTEVVPVTEGETKRSFLEKSVKALNIPCYFDTFSFPDPGKTDLSGAYILFPALKISMDKGKVIYLIDFDLDQRLNGFLSEKIGILVIKY